MKNCDDGNACTEDWCLPSSGACQHNLNTCDDGSACTTDSCNPSDGTCENLLTDCDDGNACTLDWCIPDTGACVNDPEPLDGVPCDDDGIECTNDVCMGGMCDHPPLPDGSFCTDDGNECTDDSCMGGSCQHDPTPLDGAGCTGDGILCTDDLCSGGACTHPLNCPAGQPCCGNGECCATTCEGCFDNGSLLGGIIDVSPVVACIGDTITWTASGVTDSGGVKRVDCSAKQAIAPGGVMYEWTLTLPADYPTPLPPLMGTGASANVVAKVLGTYICNFVAKPTRTECPPDDLDLGSNSKTVSSTATLTLTPSVIAPTTTWPGMPAGLNQTDITVTWDPPECVGTLEIVELDTSEGYVPPGEGTLEQNQVNDTLWRYTAFSEPLSEKWPKNVKARIAAFIGDVELPNTRKNILVLPVHGFFTSGAGANFTNDFNYISWKYAIVLATTGGAFAGPPSISMNACVPCPDLPWPLPDGPCVAACTDTDDSVFFGTSAFVGRSENSVASIIGHELVHTVGLLPQSECTAYTWEINNSQQTGIFQCDVPYLQDVLQNQNCECNGCP